MNISLPDEMKAWIEERVGSGVYAGASDCVRDLVRKDQERAEALRRLHAAIDEGMATPSRPFETDELLVRLRSRMPKRQGDDAA